LTTRQENDDRLAVSGFLRGLPESMYAICQEECVQLDSLRKRAEPLESSSTSSGSREATQVQSLVQKLREADADLNQLREQKRLCAVSELQAKSTRRQLLPCLEGSAHAEGVFEATHQSPSASLAPPSRMRSHSCAPNESPVSIAQETGLLESGGRSVLRWLDSPAQPAADVWTMEVPRPSSASPVQTPTPEQGQRRATPPRAAAHAPVVPVALEDALHSCATETGVAVDDMELQTEAHWHAEYDALKKRLADHKPDWKVADAETCNFIGTEDLLSRYPDLETFWFFETRDLVNTRLDGKWQTKVPKLGDIPEYPANTPRWQIQSDRARSSMRSRKRSLSRPKEV